MEPSAARAAATGLLDAAGTGKPVPPLSLPIEDAYTVQAAQVRLRADAGETVRGHRIAGASVAARRRWKATEPVHGTVFAGAFQPEHRPVAASFIRPAAEASVAFVLGTRLSGPEVTTADVLRAVAFVLPALEITDSRIDDEEPGAADVAADNASAGVVVLGASPVDLSTVDLRLAGCVLYRRGAVAATGAGGLALGSPVNALAWLANSLSAQGFTLEPGQVVLSGALTPPVAVSPGDSVQASIAGLGSVTTVLAEGQS
ncbi:2-keto-4-pentenoate hydratase [Amycolatopsis sp. NPDC059021]|uniref:2-keto-4-pentenoate hydratase n=1 Tax=Amycolatopsis sp. NPDC059021 TaxID=3346704 RepID=UPI00366BB138